MHIRMTNTEYGSVDGIRVASYEAGQEYDLTATAGAQALAAAFVAAGLAQEMWARSATANKPAVEQVPAVEKSAAEGAEAPAVVQPKTGRKPKVP